MIGLLYQICVEKLHDPPKPSAAIMPPPLRKLSQEEDGLCGAASCHGEKLADLSAHSGVLDKRGAGSVLQAI